MDSVLAEAIPSRQVYDSKSYCINYNSWAYQDRRSYYMGY